MLDEVVQERIMCSISRLSLESYVEDISLVYGDLSPRRYFRVTLKKEAPFKTESSTLMVMYFDSVVPPEAETKIVKSSFESYLEIGDYFLRGGIPVPEVYLFAEDLSIILLEDLGSRPLITLAESKDASLEKIYKEAAEGIHHLQALKPPKDFFPYLRGFDREVYRKEMSEFTDFFLPEDMEKEVRTLIENVFSSLSSELESFPKTLVHRDYHSWNLMVDFKDRLRVIDFQDALMGTRSYDLVALVHERDIDQILGDEMVDVLEDHFFSVWNDRVVRDYEYPRVLLQRDLKVAGRFSKVAKTRGLTQYAKWIPGTVKRISKTLSLLSSQSGEYEALKNVLIPYLGKEYADSLGLV
jgi:aminoglycoside/choline kinase family phosphotransferase